jgi:hypothetical protein
MGESAKQKLNSGRKKTRIPSGAPQTGWTSQSGSERESFDAQLFPVIVIETENPLAERRKNGNNVLSLGGWRVRGEAGLPGTGAARVPREGRSVAIGKEWLGD